MLSGHFIGKLFRYSRDQSSHVLRTPLDPSNTINPHLTQHQASSRLLKMEKILQTSPILPHLFCIDQYFSSDDIIKE